MAGPIGSAFFYLKLLNGSFSLILFNYDTFLGFQLDLTNWGFQM